jgi:hypothetical protein
MVSFFSRHEVDKQGSSWSSYGKGRQAWDGWGGEPAGAGLRLSPAGWMQSSAQSSAQRSNAVGADSRTIEPQPTNRRPTSKNQHCIRSSLSPEPGKPIAEPIEDQKRGVYPQNVKPAQGASKISQVLGNQSARAALALLS